MTTIPPKKTKKDKKEGLLQEEGLQEGQGGPQAEQGELQQQRVQREEYRVWRQQQRAPEEEAGK